MKHLFILMVVFLAACSKIEAESTQRVGNDAKVEKLFTVDNCTVYRFYDEGYKRYFTNCSGSTQWTEGCGKNCSRPMGISGGN